MYGLYGCGLGLAYAAPAYAAYGCGARYLWQILIKYYLKIMI